MDCVVSQPARSLWAISMFWENLRHFHALVRQSSVSALGIMARHAPYWLFWRPVSGREFSISKFKLQRLGSIALRQVLMSWP